MKSCYIVGNYGLTGATASLMGSIGFSIVNNLQDADLAVFTGGEDISPDFYGHPRHHSTYTNAARNELEKEAYDKCIAMGKPMVGICRGGQLLNALSGGWLYQNVSGHGSAHMMKDLITGQEIITSSIHHQMMHPSEDAIIVAVSHEFGNRVFPHFKSDDNKHNYEWVTEQSETDYEVLYYDKTKSLCFQGHPELTERYYGEPLRIYFKGLINRYLFAA